MPNSDSVVRVWEYASFSPSAIFIAITDSGYISYGHLHWNATFSTFSMSSLQMHTETSIGLHNVEYPEF